MSLKNDVLRELVKVGDYVSGEQLARRLGKSRAAVWKAVKSLEADGYEIDAVTNRGYAVKNNKAVVSAQGIASYLPDNVEALYYPCVDSTNNCCKRMLADGKKGLFLVCAGEQSAGRGRQGKSFYSPAKTGIYFSLVLRPDTSLTNAVSTTTAASVAVCQAIEELTGLAPEIKWVNDVYLDGRKICGILTEAITNFEEGTVEAVVVGIGVNISTTDFPDEVENGGSLNIDVNKNALIARIATRLIEIADGDYKGFIDYYREHSMILGREIIFYKNGESTCATAVEIDNTGGLVVKLPDGTTQTLRSGEISVRKL